MKPMPQNSSSRPETASRSSLVAWSRRLRPSVGSSPDAPADLLTADFDREPDFVDARRLDGPQVVIEFTVPRGRAPNEAPLDGLHRLNGAVRADDHVEPATALARHDQAVLHVALAVALHVEALQRRVGQLGAHIVEHRVGIEVEVT